ncbi:DNA alkylation repair protein [Maribacter halichondriae]|uniref:DNA alkylation repair protein n=1 Tax=Maribacter halichondriae TaxID=2980554 RepID=UPI002358AB53|nr:DNA alkylation repair protein [Maribacter sp. Hal144]
MHEFIRTLESEFSTNADSKVAFEQKAYLKNQFEFFGMKTEARRIIQKPFLIKSFLPPKGEAKEIIKELWLKPEREYQYFSQELAQRYIKQFEKSDIELFEFMVVNKSWWDTVDVMVTKLIGEYFKTYPEQRERYVRKWIDSKNIWLQRSAILFQLMYKEKLDTQILTFVINSLLGSKEFFINKAIGWVLRQYSRTNPNWVIDFVNKTSLAPLSRREALKLIS